MHNITIINALSNPHFEIKGNSNHLEAPIRNSNSIHSNTRLKGNPHSRRLRAPNEKQRKKIAEQIRVQSECDKINYETTPSKISLINGKVDEINMNYDATFFGLSCKDIINSCAPKGTHHCEKIYKRPFQDFQFYDTKSTITFYKKKEPKEIQ